MWQHFVNSMKASRAWNSFIIIVIMTYYSMLPSSLQVYTHCFQKDRIKIFYFFGHDEFVSKSLELFCLRTIITSFNRKPSLLRAFTQILVFTIATRLVAWPSCLSCLELCFNIGYEINSKKHFSEIGMTRRFTSAAKDHPDLSIHQN